MSSGSTTRVASMQAEVVLDRDFERRPWGVSRIRGIALRDARTQLWALMVLWAGGFAATASREHVLILSQRYDLGNMTQAIWNSVNGHLLEVTEVGGAQVSRLGIHVDPVLLAFVPLWWLWSNPLLLVVAQSIALSLGALPVFWLAREHLRSDRLGLLFGCLYLLYPALGWSALNDFHPVALAVPLLLFAIWFLDQNRLLPFVLVAVPAALCQEQIGLLLAGLGVWYGVRSGRHFAGAVITATSAAWVFLCVFVIIPHFAEGSSPFFGRYQTAGGSPSGVAQTFFTDPSRILGTALTGWDFLGVAILALPLLGLFFRSWISLVALPQLLLLLLSDRVADLHINCQTVLPLVPFMFAGTIYAVAGYGANAARVTSRLLIATGAAVLLLSPLARPSTYWPTNPERSAETAALALIPEDAPVAATNKLGGHLSERRFVYVFPVVAPADWIVVDTNDPLLPSVGWLARRDGISVGTRDLYRQPGLLQRIVTRLSADPAWNVVFQRDGILVFRRQTTVG